MFSTRDDPWVPYEPTAADPWDLGKVAHLHRRAGFGATCAELQRDLKAGPAASVDRLMSPPAPAPAEREAIDGLREGILPPHDMQVERLKAYWLYRIVFGTDPLREKLTLFWHGHFATSNRKVQNVERMLVQNELLRSRAPGAFADLVKAILVDPAMLVWLDGAGSLKEKPNENLAREFLELFTLGAGHYSEADIRQAARALTGWVSDGKEGDYAAPLSFEPTRFDDGVKTFMKQTGPWTAADVVRITLEQPAAAEFLGRKLYRFLVRDDVEPEPGLLRALAGELRLGGYSIAGAVELILRSRHFYSRAVRRQLIKSPVEFSAGLVRMVETPRPKVDLLALATACERQGQSLFYPPNVKGWDGGRSWFSSAHLLARSNRIADVVWGHPGLGIEPFDVAGWAASQGVEPARAVEGLADLLIQDDLAPEVRGLALAASHDDRPDSLRKALQILLECPEFQLC